MSQSLMFAIAGAGIITLGGLMMIWWLTSRLRQGRGRNLIRVFLFPLFLVIVGIFGLVIARSQANLLPQNTPVLIPAETLTVQRGTLTQTLNATGSLEAADETTLMFGASAPVTDVLVSVGDQVHAGDVLARVDTTSVDAQIHSAEINLESAQAALTALQAPPSDLDVKSAQLSVQAAQASLSSASQTGATTQDVQIAALNEELAKNQLWQSQLNRDISAARANPNAPNAYASEIQTDASLAQSESNITSSELSYDATTNDGPDAGQLASANAQLVSAQANLDELMAGPSNTDLRKAQIDVQTAQLAVDAAQKQRDETTLVAPFDGIVAAVNVAVGEMPAATGAITLINTSNYTITLSVDEKDIAQLAVGQAVNVSLEALNNVTLTGTVTRIDLAPSDTSDLVTYAVDVTLNPTDALVRPGMTAVAKVVLKEVKDVLVVPNRFITTNATTGASTVKVETAPGTYKDVVVTLGATTDSESEVSSGLNEGETLVILASGTSTSTTTQRGLGLLGGALGGGGAAGEPPGGTGGFPGGTGRRTGG